MPLGIIILGIAAFCNIRHGTVPNWLVACLLISFVATVLVTDLPATEIKTRAAVFAVTLLIFFVLFCFEMVGGGAAKLIAVTTLWLAWPLSAYYAASLLAFTVILELLNRMRDSSLLEQINEHHATIAAVSGMLLLSVQLLR